MPMRNRSLPGRHITDCQMRLYMSFRKPRRRPLPRHITLHEATRNHAMKFARPQRDVLRGEVEPPKRTSVVSAGGKYDAATVGRPCGMHIVAFLLLDALHPLAIRVDKQNLKADTAELGRSGQTQAVGTPGTAAASYLFW